MPGGAFCEKRSTPRRRDPSTALHLPRALGKSPASCVEKYIFINDISRADRSESATTMPNGTHYTSGQTAAANSQATGASAPSRLHLGLPRETEVCASLTLRNKQADARAWPCATRSRSSARGVETPRRRAMRPWRRTISRACNAGPSPRVAEGNEV
jgi:hypothetical protein